MEDDENAKEAENKKGPVVSPEMEELDREILSLNKRKDKTVEL